MFTLAATNAPVPWKNNAECQSLIKQEGLRTAELQAGLQPVSASKNVSAPRANHDWAGGNILQAAIAQNARGDGLIGGATEAAKAGHDVVIVAFTYDAYFDF